MQAALLKRNPALADLGPLSLSGVTGGEITGRMTPVARNSPAGVEFHRLHPGHSRRAQFRHLEPGTRAGPC
ncbi:MAG: hypothetical protein WDN06_11395 [Asticcacaulis sp.]